MGNLGIRKVCATIVAREFNSSVQTVIVGILRFSSSMASWIHHDVQEPQSAIARRTRSHFASISSNISTGAWDAALGFSFINNPERKNSD